MHFKLNHMSKNKSFGDSRFQIKALGIPVSIIEINLSAPL